jgi:flagellar basal-body rod modification protein FlgD
MSVSAIQGTLADPAAQAAAANRSPVQTLNQDQFLQLLVAQLTSQDPLNPKQDTDFIAQMAQFTGLEQTKSMQQDIAAMHSEQQILQANAMIGRSVQLQPTKDAPTSGIVSAIEIEAGTPRIVVNGTSYDLGEVRSISPATSETSHH